jgi:hypothetical protein
VTGTAAPPGASTGRRIAGLVLGLVLLVLLVYPIGVTAMFAYTSFTGCFLGCSAPEPGSGVVWSVVAGVLLAIPPTLGLVTAGLRSRAAWWSMTAVVLVAVAAWDLAAVAA